MNKIIIAIVLAAVVAIAWMVFTPASVEVDYVSDVDAEITQLEDELATIDLQVAAGSLTDEQATAAKVSIVTRLNAISATMNQLQNGRFNAAQRVELQSGLDRLKQVLISYQATLAVVEAQADEVAVEAEVRRRGGSYNPSPLTLVVADVIAEVEETVSELEGYEADVTVDAEIEAIVEEVEAEVVADAEAAAEEGTTTDEETESETTTDETEEADMDSVDSDLGGSMNTMDAAVEVEASGDVEVETETELQN